MLDSDVRICLLVLAIAFTAGAAQAPAPSRPPAPPATDIYLLALPGGIATMQASGLSYDQALQSLTNNVQGQAVMIGTNQLMMLCAIAFVIAAFTIWFAPKPRAGVDLSAVH